MDKKNTILEFIRNLLPDSVPWPLVFPMIKGYWTEAEEAWTKQQGRIAELENRVKGLEARINSLETENEKQGGDMGSTGHLNQ